MENQTVDFETLISETPADSVYSLIFIEFHPDSEPLGTIVSIIEKNHGKIVNIDILNSSMDGKKIAFFKLRNTKINDIVMRIAENLSVNVKGCSPVLKAALT